MSGIIQAYDDIGAFFDEMQKPEYKSQPSAGHHGGGFLDDWQGGVSGIAEMIRVTREGVSKHNDAIDALRDKVQCELPSMTDCWEPSIAGVFPIVPAAIAGLPDNMLMKDQREDTGVPLKIFIGCGTGANYGERHIRARGIAMCALLQVLATRRPCEMYLYDDNGNREFGLVTPVIRIQSSPLDMATMTASLIHPGFFRILMFSWTERRFQERGYRWPGSWAHSLESSHPEAQRKTREQLGTSAQDLVFFGGANSDMTACYNNPSKWVQDQVNATEKFYNQQVEG